MTNAMLNIATLKAVNLATSNEDTRYYLNGVFVQVRENTVTYTATDGHRLLYRCEDTAEPNTLCGDWIIPSDWIKAQKPGKYEARATMTAQPHSDKGTMLCFTGTITGMVQPIDGTFPDYRRVIPSETSGEVGQFNGTLLADFEKFAKLLSLSLATLHHNGNGPAIVTFGNAGTLGVIMPMRNRDSKYHAATALLSPSQCEAAQAAASLSIAAE